jgi:hypothetical protein
MKHETRRWKTRTQDQAASLGAKLQRVSGIPDPPITATQSSWGVPRCSLFRLQSDRRQAGISPKAEQRTGDLECDGVGGEAGRFEQDRKPRPETGGLGFRICFGFRASDLFRISCFGFRICLGFRASDLFRISCFGFRASDFGIGSPGNRDRVTRASRPQCRGHLARNLRAKV